MSAAHDDGRPWWASEGDGRVGDEDPFEAHRRARAGDADGEDRARERGRGTGASDGAASHHWWADAAELLVRLAREAGRVAASSNLGARGDGQTGRDHVHTGTVEACQICPVCAGIRILGEARPELVEHLSEAARHLTLAAKAFVDAQAEGYRRDEGLQRIDLDDE